MIRRAALLLALALVEPTHAADIAAARLVPIAPGYAATPVNAVIFRHNAVTTHGSVQFTAFYDRDAHVVLAMRRLGESGWTIHRTQLTGNPADAHNAIVLAADASGILHIMWNHHVSKLNYVQTTKPGSLELTGRLKTDGNLETAVTYPEFYNHPDGTLLLLYRVGAAGNGDIVLKSFSPKTRAWTTVQASLIAGQGRASAYTEFCIDSAGTLHLAWTWRRTADVETNHDICYARSPDHGVTWTDSNNRPMGIPITAENTEPALRIPEGSDLINQTSITADSHGNPYIATYFRPAGRDAVQLMLLHHDGRAWTTHQITNRRLPLTLAGRGTLPIPLSRPLILLDSRRTPPRTLVIFRDAERSDRITLATCADLDRNHWSFTDLTDDAYSAWEPTCDLVLWSRDHALHLFVQQTNQPDGDASPAGRNAPPTLVSIFEFHP